MVDVAYVKSMWPRLSASDTQIETAISVSQTQVSKAMLGARYSYAVACLAAHIVTIATRSDGLEVKTGDISVKYGDDLLTTHPGKEFLRIRKMSKRPSFKWFG